MDALAQVRQFHAYLRASERLMTARGIRAKLDTVAEGVAESGLFQRCVVRVYRRRFSSGRVLGAAGITVDERTRLMAGDDPPEAGYLALTARGRHLGGDCYFVPGAGQDRLLASVGAIPSRRPAAEFEDWDPDDSFIAHLYSSSRVLLGHLAADDPPDGRVPDEEGCRSFVLFATLAARLLEQELRLRTDPMTDAFNGTYLDLELERLGEECAPFTAVFADMDGLKEVNDRCGHLMGDRFIRQTHDILLEHLPADGLLYRPYGDEFVYLREGDDPSQVASCLDSITAGVEAWNRDLRPMLRQPSGGGVVPPLQVSVGLAHGRASDALSIVREAEAAMYAQKGDHYREAAAGPER